MALTMVEVLVAITILVVLAAILTPVLSRSVLAAKEAKGIEHLRQIHQIHMLYQADHGGGGGYSSLPEMGLPIIGWTWGRDIGPDWYAAGPYGMSTALHLAPCGRRGNDNRISTQFWPKWVEHYGPAYRENLSIAVHWHCSPALPTEQYKLKRASAVLLSGTAVTKVGYLPYFYPDFFAEPE